MRLDDLHLWWLADAAAPRPVGTLRLVAAGKGVSLHYDAEWLRGGFPLSQGLPLVDIEHLPPGRLATDRWGEKVIRFVDRPARVSLMESLYFAGDDRFGALGVSTSATAYLPRQGAPPPPRAGGPAGRGRGQD